MPALRDVQNKIVAVKKTRQITRAMNMVAAAKLRQVQEKTEKFKPYADKFMEVLGNLSGGMDSGLHPLLVRPERVDRIGVITLTADRGLCGSFNMGLISKSVGLIKEQEGSSRKKVQFHVVGRKGCDYFRRRDIEMETQLPGVMNNITFELAVSIARLGLVNFLEAKVQEVYIVYSDFNGMASQTPIVEKLLPIEPKVMVDDVEGEEKEESLEYITEPSAEEILADLLPRYLNVRVYSALLNTVTSEQAARMAAMDNATKNCKEMVEQLTLLYNKARQAAITADLMDIVGGAEALSQG